MRSYGRRKGHKLSDRQERLVAEVLPRVRLDLAAPAPTPLARLFAAPVGETWLEIGFGAGEHLIGQAASHTAIGFIGVEPFLNGVVKVLAAIDADRLGNVRVHDGDARDVLAWLPPGSVGRAFILFPDPWPKMRHRKRRLVNGPTVEALARVLAPGAELRLASDIADYVDEMLEVVRASGAFAALTKSAEEWRTRPPDWPPTRYEQKAAAAGRASAYLRFARL